MIGIRPVCSKLLQALIFRSRWAAMLIGLLAFASPALADPFVTFDSGQVRPLALSPDGSKLFAVDTPDGRLEIFTVDATTGNLTHSATVPVGLEPVAVAARTNSEIWVVNHLSDSVSIVDLSGAEPRVIRTLLVGDEPRDIVFAGFSGNLAFLTTAHRGQNGPVPLADLTTSGIGRADVWVFDATNLGSTLGGTPSTVITLFGDTPRALAVSPDGSTVYAAVFQSGNQTTSLSEGVVCNGGASAGSCTVDGVSYPGGLPAPNAGADSITAPETGLIVKFNPASTHWEDRLGRNWDNAVRFYLPDDDVFRIDATQNPPVAKSSSPHDGEPFAQVGTILFNMAVNPVTGKVYVSNGESHNEVRFEGQRPPCTPLTPGGPSPNSVVGHLSESRITVLDPSTGAVTPRHLNKHIDYCTVPSPLGTSAASLATPLGMAVTNDGSTLYVAAFGSSDPSHPSTTGKVGVFDTTQLEADTFTPSAANHVILSGGGASGLVLNEGKHRLYVLTRFDNAISTVDTSTAPGTEVQHQPVYNPEPASVIAGRPFLYDATLTSSNGEAACASCHIFGDFDSLAWDLGDPDNKVVHNPNPFRSPPGPVINPDFTPLKGPMTTQTLRGMVNNGPMHWRGDRTAGNDPPPNNDPLNSTIAFEKFNVAFVGLNGMPGHCSVTTTQACDDLTPCPGTELCVGISDADMQAYTDFILQVMLPPNPIRALDSSMTPDQQAGHDFYFNVTSDTVQTCNGCHVLDPANGNFGTNGFSSFENETQDLKIPHLRNLYQKIGMFGMPAVPLINTGNNGTPGPFTSQPDQVRGFGFLHDGSVDTVFRFHNASVFTNGFNPNGGDVTRRQVEQFVLAFDSDLAPVVGQQITLTSTNASTVGARISLLIQRATAGDCDLTVKGVIQNPTTLVLEQRGAVLRSNGLFQTDRASDAPLTDAQLRALAATPGQELTYTCVPPGEGTRIGIDRDLDGFFDRDELDAGTDPANPNSFPDDTTPVRGSSLTLGDDSVPPINANAKKILFKSLPFKGVAGGVALPAQRSKGDPTTGGATGGGGTLTVYNAGTGEKFAASLPATGWTLKTNSHFELVEYKYSDPRRASGPISQVTVQDGKLTLKGGGASWGYALDDPPQGSVAVRVQLGSQSAFCAVFPAKTSGKPPSTASWDKLDKFVGMPNSPAPASCPPVP